MSRGRFLPSGCYQPLQKKWKISVPKSFSDELIIEELSSDAKILDLIIKVLETLEIPTSAARFFCLSGMSGPSTCSISRNTGDSQSKDPRVNCRVVGKPFFTPLSSIRLSKKLNLRINIGTLPHQPKERERVLGKKGLIFLICQIISNDIVLTDPCDHNLIDHFCFSLRYLEDTGRKDIAENIKPFITIMHDRSYSFPILLLRQLPVIRMKQEFVRKVQMYYQKLPDNYDTNRFIETVDIVAPMKDPLSFLSVLKKRDHDFDIMVFLCQLHRIVWDEDKKRLTVEFFPKFCDALEIVTLKRRVGASLFAYLVRYLQTRNQAVICQIKNKSGEVSSICRRNSETIYTNDSGDERNTVSTVVTNYMSSQTEDDRPEGVRGYINAAKNAEEQTRFFEIHISPKVERKPAVERLLDVDTERYTSCVGMNSVLMKGAMRISPNIFAVRKPAQKKDDRKNDAEIGRLMLGSAQIAYDFYSTLWPLLPVAGIRMAEVEVLSNWMPLGSLHDCLISRDRDFTVKHFLEVAGQLSVALLYLDGLKIADVGLHPKNVLVEEHSPDWIGVRLCDAGTRSYQQKEEWGKLRDEFNYKMRDDMKDLHICLHITTMYGPKNKSSDEKDDPQNIPNYLWSRKDHFNESHLLLWSRHLLTSSEKDVVEERKRVLSNKGSLDDVPVIMRSDSDDTIDGLLGKDEVQLGQGHYGRVYKTTYRGEQVAVKQLIRDISLKDFENEVETMKKLKHKHVVELIKFSTERRLIIMKYCNEKTLLDYARNSKNIDNEEFMKDGKRFCTEICEGMDYLHQENVMHRDLALRNILLHSDNGEPPYVKISDFGLSRLLDDAIYEMKGKNKLPVYWLPPSDMESGTLTKKIDVWSFGVSAWELFTHGGSPSAFYANYLNQMNNPCKALYEVVVKRKILLSADGIDSSIYHIMKRCWAENPDDRPDFSQLIKEFNYLPNS